MSDQKPIPASELDAQEKNNQSKHPAEQPWVSDVLSLHSKVAEEKKAEGRRGGDEDG
jgi:hypothetical protein